jgi:hypothetical protein
LNLHNTYFIFIVNGEVAEFLHNVSFSAEEDQAVPSSMVIAVCDRLTKNIDNKTIDCEDGVWKDITIID